MKSRVHMRIYLHTRTPLGAPPCRLPQIIYIFIYIQIRPYLIFRPDARNDEVERQNNATKDIDPV